MGEQAGSIAALNWRARTVAVCVPVRDERDLLPRFAVALAQQTLPQDISLQLCIFFDGCTDDSSTALRAVALPFPVVAEEGPKMADANAGRARRRAMAIGARALHGRAGGVLMSTDADSVPDADWVAANCRALEVADVATGRVVREGGAMPGQDRIEHYYDRLYAMRRRIDPVAWEDEATHHYTSATSMAFRAEAYAALGGFAPRAAGEDGVLIDDARRAGLRVRHDAAIRVVTSARHDGRAVGGMADHLRRMASGTAAAARMAHPEDAAWRYAAHAAARAAFATPAGLAPLARRIGLAAEHVRAVADASPNAEAFAMRVVPDPPGGERLVSIDIADAALDRMAS